MTNKNKNLKGFSIARWVQEETVNITDSNTYIGDDGTIIADGAVGGSSLVLINPDDGGQLNLLSATGQEGAISSLVFPDKLGIKNQHLRLKNTPSLNESKMYLEWADTNVGTVTTVAIATKSKGITISENPITSSGTININLNDELQALAQINDNGLIVRTDSGYTKRAIITDSNNLSITDGDGIDGNPTITLSSKISSLDSIETKTLISSELLKTEKLEIINNKKSVILTASTEQSDDNIFLIMPSNNGENGQYLKTNGEGKLSWGTLTSENGGTITSITAGTGLKTEDGKAITISGTIALKDTEVKAGTYSYMTGTVDAQGRLTSAYSSISTIEVAERGPTAGLGTLNGINGVTVSTNSVKEESIILATRTISTESTLPSMSTIGNLIIGDIKTGQSFKVYSTVDEDVGKFNWLIINTLDNDIE